MKIADLQAREAKQSGELPDGVLRLRASPRAALLCSWRYPN